MVVDKTLARKASKILLGIQAVTLNTEKPYRFTSGILSPMYTDNRLLISYRKEWNKILNMYIQVINKAVGKTKFDVFSGTATAAIPHAAVLAYLLSKPMIYVRSSKKEHGKENLIEGTFKNNSRVLIVEDLISTGKSSMQNVDAVREQNGIVESCVAITTSTFNAFESVFKEHEVALYTITDAVTTVETALQEKLINAKQFSMVKSFFEDSFNWGKKMGFE